MPSIWKKMGKIYPIFSKNMDPLKREKPGCMAGRAGHLVADLTLIAAVPPSWSAAMPIMPDSHLPQQNRADSGTAKILTPSLRPEAQSYIQVVHLVVDYISLTLISVAFL